ncbi:15366_t:CDS:2 [Racocetra fulgida]|uniref:15366_t:CDS:1 n=1 Tax=Racocetra fulgida TaxID=60492 RepID=A0A9N8VKD0_9GLOM|nr:15366_t:CDS:2 [Racocetra fulgida]
MSKQQISVNTGKNRLETSANTSINGPSDIIPDSFSPDQILHRNYGSLVEHSQSFGQESPHDESELSKSHGHIIEDPTSPNDEPLSSRRGASFSLRLPSHSNTLPNARRTARSHGKYSTTPGSYSASFSSERVPWNALRYYQDNLSPTYDESFEDPIALTSPNYDDGVSISGVSISSVIMDDGSLQRRRISLTSEPSSTPLLNGYNSDSDSERVDTDKQYVDDINYTDKSVQSAIESYRGTFTSLREILRQASLEIHNGNMQQKIQLYEEVVESLTRLAQHLGGLRSCCGLQWEIIKDSKDKDKDKTSNNKPGENEESCDLKVLLELIRHVGPPMKSLAYTCKQTLFHLQEQFVETDKSYANIKPSFTLLRQNLHSALELFEKSQSRALTKLYKQRTAKSYFDDRPNEEVFLIYFFVFNLQEFTRELSYLVDLTDNISRIDASEQKRREGRRWWQFWRYSTWFSRNTFYTDNAKKFPENTHNLFDTIQTPKPKTLPQKLAIKLWQSFSWFRQFEVKYAVKAAVSAAILASPAFIESTRGIYARFRGEWVCITMMVVMVPTVGGTNLMGVYRILGTLLGCFLAWIIDLQFSEDPYNIRNSKSTEISEIALYRFIAVGTGVVWGVLVTSYWWPYEARVELRKGLSQLFVNMGWLYKKLVAIYSVPSEVQDESNPNHVSVMIKNRLSISTKEFMEMELFLQISLLRLHSLLEQTPNEPRMKGPFPVSTYRQILIGCQNILDKLLSMRIAVTKEEWYSIVRKDFIVPIAEERRELVGNVLLYFYVLAAALRLKTPLPPYLPPAERARRQLLKKIRDLPVVRKRVVEGNDEHYIVYYAYVLVMEDVIRELESLGIIMQELYGCMGGDEFNAFFFGGNEETGNEHIGNGGGVGSNGNLVSSSE